MIALSRAAAIAALIGAFAVVPASADVLVSNIGQNGDKIDFEINVALSKGATAFTTGSNTAGYVLESVDLVLGDIDTDDVFTVSILTANASGGRGDVYATLINPTLADGVNTFTAPPGTELDANTKYFVHFERTAGDFTVQATLDDDEDAGAATGWSIADNGEVFLDEGSFSEWLPLSGDRSHKFRINGQAINTPATGAPVIEGTPMVGETLTAGLGDIADADGLPATTFPDGYSFQWVRQDDMAGAGATDIGGATEQTYTLDADDDLGKYIAVRVTFEDSGGREETRTGVTSEAVSGLPESDLEEARRESAAVLLRRHVDRFASVSSGAALGRLQGLAPPTTVNAQISARSHKLDAGWNGDGAKSSGWAGWSRLFYGWVEGPGDGAVYDLYLGVDWRAPDGRYVIGGLLGHEGADLRLDEGGRFRSRITQVGLYGATYLSDALILDGALAYGFGRPELSQGGVTAEYDTERFTIRADLTGGVSWREGAVVIEPQAGVLHVQEKLGAFEDSTGAPGAAETLRLTRFGVGPRLTWALPGGTFTGRARVNWDRHNLEGDGDKVSDLSASLDARLRYDLEGGLSAEFFGAADGIGLSGDQQTYTAGVSISFRF